jgi:hypothetical protein
MALSNLSYIESNYPGTDVAKKATTLKDVIGRKKETIAFLLNTDIQKADEKILGIPYEERPPINASKHEISYPKDRFPLISQYPIRSASLKRPRSGIEPILNSIEKRTQLSYIESPPNTAANPASLKPLKEVKVDMIYIYNSSEPYHVLMIFEQMDQVYRNEAKIALERYNNTSRGGQDIILKLYEPKNESAWLEIGPFASLGSSMGYYDEIAPNMSKIIPWLATRQYQLIVISENNLNILKTRKDLSEYLLFIRQYVKDKF